MTFQRIPEPKISARSIAVNFVRAGYDLTLTTAAAGVASLAFPHVITGARAASNELVFVGFGGSYLTKYDTICRRPAFSVFRRKPAPDLIRGVQRFSEKIMLKQKARAG